MVKKRPKWANFGRYEKKNEFNGWKLNVMQYWTNNCDIIWEKMNFDFF